MSDNAFKANLLEVEGTLALVLSWLVAAKIAGGHGVDPTAVAVEILVDGEVVSMADLVAIITQSLGDAPPAHAPFTLPAAPAVVANRKRGKK